MPPKKGKKGKKGKKSGKGKKSQKIALTPKEEIIQYQISLKQDILGPLRFECEKINTDNKKIQEKLDRYKYDRNKFSEEMLRQYREFLKSKNISDHITRDKSDVISAMKTNWKIERIEQLELSKLNDKIKSKEDGIRSLKSEIKNLEYLRDEEINKNDSQIKHIKNFIEDMNNNFSAVCNYTKKNFHDKKTEILLEEDLSIEQLQNKASLKASSKVTDDAKHELSDNQWLINKSKFHEKNLDNLKRDIEILQSENIELHELIFQLNQNNEQFNQFYLTEIEPNDILFQKGLLEYNPKDIFDKHQFYPKNKVIKQTDLEDTFNDYLNFNSIDSKSLSITGKAFDLKERPIKSEEEIMQDMFTYNELPFSLNI